MNDFTVRDGTPADVSAVYALVRELAQFERAAHEVVTNPEVLLRDLEAGFYSLLLAEQDAQVVGMMLYHRAYSTWKGRMLYLEDFCVAPQHRSIGIGQALWTELRSRAKQLGCTSIKWQVLAWNEGAIAFYKREGAQIEEGWLNGRLFI